MPVIKWIKKDDRDDNSKFHPNWKNSSSAQTGYDNEITIVKQALATIMVCLTKAAASDTTDLYLKQSKTTYTKKFNNGVGKLKKHVQSFQGTSRQQKLYIAHGLVPNALASSPPTTSKTLTLDPNNYKSSTTIIIQPSFITGYTVGLITKTLSDWGRCKTILHELTHSLLLTKDVWFKNSVYGLSPPNPDFAVTTDQECKTLAIANDIDSDNQLPLCWMNAENWTNAIASCHPILSGNSDFN
ncbi:MAG: hypothetical protein MUO63_13195 [Desulfobulbaceae bacterium]|nr:hypothetical protein [Desulfobulbaceae bacterium]